MSPSNRNPMLKASSLTSTRSTSSRTIRACSAEFAAPLRSERSVGLSKGPTEKPGGGVTASGLSSPRTRLERDLGDWTKRRRNRAAIALQAVDQNASRRSIANQN